MNAIEAIFSRRSIRKYTDQPVPEQFLETLLKAAMSAPSAGNEQPWQFVLIRERQTLDDIPDIHPHSAMLKEAPLAIVVCGDLKLEKHQGYWVQDCSAATQNLLVAAQALGLGAVWLGVYPREDRVQRLKRLLQLPQSVIPLCIVSVGFPAEIKPPGERFDASRIHYERWGNLAPNDPA